MKYIDLHVHSNHSDGTFTPTELVEEAIKHNLAAFALTDHDTVEGIPEALLAAEKAKEQGMEIRVLPGVELSVGYKKKDIHILGLLIDYTNSTFSDTLEVAQAQRDRRNIKMAQNLFKAGINITIGKLREAEGNAVLTRAHFAKFLVENGYCKTTKDAFLKYLNSDGPYFVPREYMSSEKAIELIRTAGGVPVLAHPLLYKLPVLELKMLISQLKEYGLLGIEAIYSSNINNEEAFVKSLARKNDLLITGGSDFHGANKPLLDIGIGKGNLKIPYEILEALEQKISHS